MGTEKYTTRLMPSWQDQLLAELRLLRAELARNTDVQCRQCNSLLGARLGGCSNPIHDRTEV